MRPYIQSKNGIPGGVNFFNAYQGFSEMGLECVLFNNADELASSRREDVVIGGSALCSTRLHALTFGLNRSIIPKNSPVFWVGGCGRARSTR